MSQSGSQIMAGVDKTENISRATDPDVDVEVGMRSALSPANDTENLQSVLISSGAQAKVEAVLGQTIPTQPDKAAIEEPQVASTSNVSQDVEMSSISEAMEQPVNFVDRISRWFQSLGVKVASRPVGQTLFRQGDHVLYIVQQCMLWSAHPADSGDAVERPLPWIMFLPVLTTLKVVGAGVKLATNLLGKKVDPTEQVVNYIRSHRRQIHAIKYRGTCNMRKSTEETQETPQDKPSIVEKLLLWWPVTVVTKMASLMGLGSQGQEQTKTSPVKRNYQQMIGDEPSDEASPQTSQGETSDEGDEEKTEIMQADDLIKKINEIQFEEEDSDADPDYEPNEVDISSSTTSSEEDLLSEEENLLAGEMEVDTLLVPRTERKDSDSSTTITADEPRPGDHDKDLFVSASSTGYQSPESRSLKTSRDSSPDRDQRPGTPAAKSVAEEKKPSKFSKLFSRKT